MAVVVLVVLVQPLPTIDLCTDDRARQIGKGRQGGGQSLTRFAGSLKSQHLEHASVINTVPGH